MDKSQLQVLQLSCSSKKELPKIAESILKFAETIKIWLFVGDLGAGKTTLIKQVCHLLGVEDEVASPTFAIVNEYLAPANMIYHFDFYRLNDVKEALNIGVDEYLYSGNYCFIEWPQKIEEILPEKFLIIKITGSEDEKRVFNLTKYE